MVSRALVWLFPIRGFVRFCFECGFFIGRSLETGWYGFLVDVIFYPRSGWCSCVIGFVVPGNVISIILRSLLHVYDVVFV